MLGLERQGIDCASCTGVCCSFIANSMQTTPLEAIEIIAYLDKLNLITEELIANLKQVVKDYRLDYHLDTGNGHNLRRTYNCPFYTPGSKGCGLSRSVKPLGCLAFNPGKLSSKDGEGCAPGFEILEFHQKQWGVEEEKANALIKKTLDLHWEKLPMPVALLDLLQKEMD